jgi:uncharacterized protein
MNTTIFTTSYYGNNYYLDLKKRLVGYAHPVLSFVDNYLKQHGTLDNIPDAIDIYGVGCVKKETINYYIKKHNFLSQHGLNINNKIGEIFDGALTSDMINYEIANLSQLTFEVTDSCNLNCKYCGYNDFYNGYDKRENNRLSFDVAKRIIDYIVEKWNSPLNNSYKGVSYISFYGGEPLLCIPLIKKIIEYINSLKINRKIIFSMTSNGLLINEYENFLVDNNIKLLISLDGNEYNNSYRVSHSGTPSFKKIFKNAKHLSTEYPEYFKDNVSFISVLHNRNSVEDIFYFFGREFKKTPSIIELNTSGIQEGKRKEFLQIYKNLREDLNQSEHYDEIVNELLVNSPDMRSLAIFMKQHSGVFFSSYIDLFNETDKDLSIPTGTCLPFSKKMFITVNGKILPCERIGHRFSLGTVTEKSVNINTKLISAKYNAYFNKLKNKCSSCYRNHSCSQCIFNLDDIDELKPKCKGYLNYEMFAEYFSQIISYLETHPDLYSTIINKIIIE